MATPCCPKCSHTHFLRAKNASLRVWLVYCGHCGAVAGTMPLGFKASKTKTATDGWINSGTVSSGGSGTGTTAFTDDWETA